MAIAMASFQSQQRMLQLKKLCNFSMATRTRILTRNMEPFILSSLPPRIRCRCSSVLLFPRGGGQHDSFEQPLSSSNGQRAKSHQQHHQHHHQHHHQQHRHFHSFFPWNVRPPPKGTGFDNFIPEENQGGSDATKSSSQTSNGGGNNNNGDDPNGNSILIMFLMLVIGLTVASYLDSANNNSSNNEYSRRSRRYGGNNVDHHPMDDEEEEDAILSGTSGAGSRRTITWVEFLRLLRNHQVQKIVISEPQAKNGTSSGSGSSTHARVYVKNHHDHHRNAMNDTDYHHHNNDASSPTYGTMTIHSSDSSGTSQPVWPSEGGGISTLSPGAAVTYYRLPIGSIDAFERKLDDAQKSMGYGSNNSIPVQYAAPNTAVRELMGIVPGLLIALLVYGMLRVGTRTATGSGSGGGGGLGGLFQFGKSTHKRIKKQDIKVTFADVAGCDEAKKEIMEFVDFLRDSERFTSLGAKIPKGALLCGPPGTGKTLLAKAVAGEAGVPFYSISGSDFIEMFVGVGPSRVRDLFSEARANSPCIIFIDEIDAVGRKRSARGVGGNDERENTLNQLLVEMDGFTPTTGIVVLAGTNRVDILDQALTRPGRFDRQISVDKPDVQGRREIFKVHLKGITLESADVTEVASRLAGLTPGFAGADIANICNEAAIVAARRNGESVTMADFEKATDRIIGGLESNKIMSVEERSIVAHHEAGHAVAVTIIPRSSGALGFAQYLPKEVFLRTRDQIMDVVCMALAGRAAEEIFFGRVTTGASDDLKRVTKLVYSTIQLYGMNTRLGQLSFPKDPNAMFDDRPYSEKTAKAMDEEAKMVVDEAYQRTLTLLRGKKDDVEKVAKLLLEKETITHDEVVDLIGARPFQNDAAYQQFVSSRLGLNNTPKKEEKTADTAEEKSFHDLTPGLA